MNGYKRNFKYFGVVFVIVILFAIFGEKQQEEVSPQEREKREDMVSQLARLEPYDLVLDKSGAIMMVSSIIDDSDDEKKHWSLAVQRRYLPNAPRQPLWVLATQIKEVYNYDEIDAETWKFVSMYYISGKTIRMQ